MPSSICEMEMRARAQTELEEQKGGYSICRQLFVGTDIGVLWTFSISIAWELHMRRFGRDEHGEEKKIHKQYCPVKIYRSFGRDEDKEGPFSQMRERGRDFDSLYRKRKRKITHRDLH